eukprot:1336672-Amorphochlora_amoeboformis.AAC.1
MLGEEGAGEAEADTGLDDGDSKLGVMDAGEAEFGEFDGEFESVYEVVGRGVDGCDVHGERVAGRIYIRCCGL